MGGAVAVLVGGGVLVLVLVWVFASVLVLGRSAECSRSGRGNNPTSPRHYLADGPLPAKMLTVCLSRYLQTNILPAIDLIVYITY